MVIREGNLLDMFDNNEFDVIAHGCNCFHTMGAGIAKQIADRYVGPTLVDCDYTTYADIDKLGCFTYCYPFHDERKIYNLYTQYNFGSRNDLNYDALSLCLYKLNVIEKGQRIGLPMIGCGLAGGNIEVVKDIITTKLKDCNVTLVKYKEN